MSGGQKVLVAIDLSDESGEIIERARSIAGDGDLHLVHVQEPMDTVYMGVVPFGPVFPGVDEAEDKLRDELRKRLDHWATRFSVAAGQAHLRYGTPASEIKALADEIDCDLIVIGTHGQKGVQLLLGSTANSVLHGACHDVLAVRVGAKGDD
ncbi:universal stress protein [Marinihelvus fidelis]|uniref:universal stress protein n=1 Tax=Marinihelvus fidelis TaxID=2613842 RepID=UPI0017877B4A|nr:universal stress protein [Marinihelvus fidelis]